MEALAALRLQLEWGADEALAEVPINRLVATRAGVLPAIPAGVARPALARATPPQPSPASGGGLGRGSVHGQPASLPAAGLLPIGPAGRAADIAAAAATREELRAALAAFGGCALADTATNLVFADGDPDAGLMLVGEAPGAEEDRAGRPFVGPSGQLLDRMLASIGLDRTRFLITNLIPWRPPGNRNPTEGEVLLCLPFLLRHIALARPRYLVLLGALATRALTGSNAGIRRMRGKWLEIAVPGVSEPLSTLPMFHPAYLLRTPGAKREAWADLLSLKRRMDADLTGT